MVVVTDEEAAIWNALGTVVSERRQIMCRWPLFNTIRLACAEHGASKEDEKKVIAQFRGMSYAGTIGEFERLCEDMIARWTPAEAGLAVPRAAIFTLRNWIFPTFRRPFAT